VRGMRVRDVLTAAQNPWQAPFVEGLCRILTRYRASDHRPRTHLSLEIDAPDGRPLERLALGRVVQIPEVGGLHHRYVRRAA